MSKRTSLSKDEACKSKKNDLDIKKEAKTSNKCSFKVDGFQHSGAMRSGRKKTWKSLKQIASAERSQIPVDSPSYMSIESPPPLKPPRKYSDISGQLAKYTDPETGLYYSTVDEYKHIKRLPADIVQGYLAIRNPSRI